MMRFLAAFDVAAATTEAIGLHFLSAIALRDQWKHALIGAGRGEEGRQRVEAAVAGLACSVEDLDAVAFP